MRSVHLLIKPASGMCNMRCQYCFYADETSKRETPNYGIMSRQTISAVLEHALEAAELRPAAFCHTDQWTGD